MTTTEKRRTMTVAGDARDTVGQFRGPNARGELLIIDEAVYACPECGTASDWTPPQHRAGCSRPTYRTRLYLRLPTDDEVLAASTRPADGLPTRPWDLPTALAGAMGYTDFACAMCRTPIRQHGIADASKAWGLCAACLATPAGQEAVNAKRREIRQQQADEMATMVEEARPAPGSTSGPVTIRILGLASGDLLTPYDGQWLVEYDPTRPGRDPVTGEAMTAHIVTTPDRAQARVFPDGEAAWAEWKRESGLPYPRNAPLTAFSISITNVDVPDDVEQTPSIDVPWSAHGDPR